MLSFALLNEQYSGFSVRYPEFVAELLKASEIKPLNVIPAEAGIHFCIEKPMDSGLRRELSRTVKPGMTAWGYEAFLMMVLVMPAPQRSSCIFV
jgi:hypothetical protein